MNQSQVDELFKQTLTGDYDDDAAWAAVTQLRLNGNRAIFLRAADWLQSADALKRARATAILAKLRSADAAGTENPQPLFREEALRLICELLENETDAMVLADGITALAHLQDPVTIPVVVKYKDHIDWSVRFAVAFALGQFPEDPMSVPALMWLTDDVDTHVRDWAVFSLGVMGDADSPDIRGVLLRRVFDSDWDVREEAIVGLAKRRDVRVLPFLRGILESADLSVWTVESAATMLGFAQPLPDWTADDYKMALDEKFGTSRIA